VNCVGHVKVPVGLDQFIGGRNPGRSLDLTPRCSKQDPELKQILERHALSVKNYDPAAARGPAEEQAA